MCVDALGPYDNARSSAVTARPALVGVHSKSIQGRSTGHVRGRSSRHAGDVRRVQTPAARAYARCAGGARPSAPPRPPARPWPLHPARRRRQPASAVDDPDLGAGVPPEWSSLAVCAPASPESSSADASIPSSIPARETAKSISYKGELGSRQINPAWTPTKESRRLIGLAVEQTKNAAPLADLLAGCAHRAQRRGVNTAGRIRPRRASSQCSI